MNDQLVYPNEQMDQRWDLEDFNKFLLWAVDQDASDIQLVPGDAVWLRRHGAWSLATKRPVSTDEIELMLDRMLRSNVASARIKGADDVDAAHEVRRDRFSTIRFRVNGTGCQFGSSVGTSVVMRTIPAMPPMLDELSPEPVIWEHGFPSNGLVLVTGVMGSGKSTLLAAMLRWIRENQARHIITYESPVEFNLREIPNAKGPCTQIDVPTNLHSFEIAPRNSARRAADVILMGESRDQETLRSMIEASEIGVAAYSTVHTRSVSETPDRIIGVFPANLQNQIAATLVKSLRMIIQQRLVPKIGGGRQAIREILAIDANMRHQLSMVPMTNISMELQRMLEAQGQTLLVDAEKKYAEGLISKAVVEDIRREFERN